MVRNDVARPGPSIDRAVASAARDGIRGQVSLLAKKRATLATETSGVLAAVGLRSIEYAHESFRDRHLIFVTGLRPPNTKVSYALVKQGDRLVVSIGATPVERLRAEKARLVPFSSLVVIAVGNKDLSPARWSLSVRADEKLILSGQAMSPDSGALFLA
jgi:hypothetical protein